jgi:hypothetical protein
MEALMATPNGSEQTGRIEYEIARVREDLGRTVAEIGTRLTPGHLVEQASRTLKQATAETTRAVASTATDVAAGLASRSVDAAVEARARVEAHPIVAGALGMGLGFGAWTLINARRNRRRLVPREWDEPFDRSSRRRPDASVAAARALPVAAAAVAAFLIWRNRFS